VLTTHHTGEDEGAFPVLAARFPELRPVIAELERDHHIVADGLRNLQRLVDGLEADPGPDREVPLRDRRPGRPARHPPDL
jgi:hemerythrin-like domain-containing protein